MSHLARVQRFCSGVAAVKSFDKIPGPKAYPIIGTLWRYLPVLGDYSFNKLHENGIKKLRDYGSVVREEIVPGVMLVWLFAPEDIQELSRREGRYPQRQSHLALQHYRIRTSALYKTGGLLPTNGHDWWKLRSQFQKGLSSPQDVKLYLPVINQVLNDFLDYIPRTKSGSDFLPHLSRIFLELLGVVTFDTRLEALSSGELDSSSRSSKLIESALTINSCILKTDNGLQLWRRFNTPLYRRLQRAHQIMDQVSLELVKTKKQEMVNSTENRSILESYLSNPHLDLRDVLGMTADMLLAGIDTTTYTTSFVLYHLATNPSVQTCLYQESVKNLPKPRDVVTSEVLARSVYLKAVLKESLRLNPVSVGVGRVLTEDAIFSGYNVPKGTIVVTQNQVMCRLEKYFKDAHSFIPERWLKDSERYEPVNPYLSLPFGHGPRTCIARRLAEQNMQALLLKTVRNFHVAWQGKPLDFETLLINKPSTPVSLIFTHRAS